MSRDLTKEQERLLRTAFRMPAVQTMVSRKSSITNAFVNAIIPVIEPTAHEIADALELLEMSPDDVRCSYCGDPATEWDHLRPLVVGRRPTGFISEIGNLVPSCGKCNQSKGNKDWEAWIRSTAPLAPARRGVADLEHRIQRLRAYALWRPVEPVDFAAMVGPEHYAEHWHRLERAIDYMKECQVFADTLRATIAAAHRKG
ncbi:MAG: HNH endonuclease [Phycisphaerae bacterium]